MPAKLLPPRVAGTPTPAGNRVIWLKSLTLAIPAAVLSSLNDVGERAVFISLVLIAVSTIWKQALRPVITGMRKIAATYDLVADNLPTLMGRVEQIEEKFESLEKIGELVDLAKDEHVRAARDALERVRSVDPPQ